MSYRKKGSMIVEACIFFPVIIIASVLLAFLIKICFVQIILVNSCYDEIHLSSLSSAEVSEHGIKDALKNNGLDDYTFSVESYIWDRSSAADDFRKVICTYKAETDVPFGFVDCVYVRDSFVTRKWTGRDSVADKYGFDTMCHEGSGRLVCIFPNDGERYHGIQCRYVRSRYKKAAYSAALEKKYHMCTACLDKKPDNGDEVYIFQYGQSYHDESCAAVKRQTVCISEQDAIIKGYSPCIVCGGS